MRGLRALLLGVRFGLALNLCGAVACGVLDVKRPGPAAALSERLPAPPPPPPAIGAPADALGPADLTPAPAPTPAPTPAPHAHARARAPRPRPRRRASASDCPADMVALPAFCIDRYEAPNVARRHALLAPHRASTASSGAPAAASVSARRASGSALARARTVVASRTATRTARRRATTIDPGSPSTGSRSRSGPTRRPSPRRRASIRPMRAAPATECVSEEGVYDLTGNVAEWVRRDGPATRPGYEHVLKGCYWAGCYHEPEPNCAFRNSAHPGTFRTYEAGFRCCRAL